eukprot:68177-Amphidinium_carterae.2
MKLLPFPHPTEPASQNDKMASIVRLCFCYTRYDLKASLDTVLAKQSTMPRTDIKADNPNQ